MTPGPFQIYPGVKASAGRLLSAALVVLLLSASFRFPLLTANRFHPDEARYAYFARLIASGRDPLLHTEVVDKPPLGFYLMALSFLLLGPGEFAARLPSMAASLLLVPLVMRLARELYRPSQVALACSVLSGLILALSPLTILFSPTIFPDALLVAFVLWSLVAATRQRWGWMGLAMGLAFACKQTAILLLPLVLAVALLFDSTASTSAETRFTCHGRTTPAPAPGAGVVPVAKRSGRCRGLRVNWFLQPDFRQKLAKAASGFLPAVVAVFLWDYARAAQISFWSQGLSDNNPGRLVRSVEVIPRLYSWADLLHYFAPSGALAALAAFGLLLLIHRSLYNRTSVGLADLILLGYCAAVLGGYWLLAFNVWSRYLLILAPLLAVLAARGLIHASAQLSSLFLLAMRNSGISLGPPTASLTGLLRGNQTGRADIIPVLLAAALLVNPALSASHSGFPVGGDTGAYEGVDLLASTIRSLPEGAVLYDHWLSWELSFYLFDGPVYISWFGTPSALADDLQAFGRKSPRYLAIPSWESGAELRAAARQAGFTLRPIYRTFRHDGSISLTLYQMDTLSVPLVPSIPLPP